MKYFVIFLIFAFSLIPTSQSMAEETGSYEMDECSPPQGMTIDENCKAIRPSPYAQQKDGIEPEEIRCNHGMYRGYKISDGTAFCASGYTLNELIHRRYAQSFDSIHSAVVGIHDSVVNEYCPASQELLQWGWYAYKNLSSVTNTNIDLVYDSKGDSHGVEFTFSPINTENEGKSMIWIFVECDDSFETFEVIILPETIEHRKNFVVYYPDEHNTTIHFVNQDTIPYKIDGMPDTGVGTSDFTIWLEPKDEFTLNSTDGYNGVESISFSASNPDTGEIYDWMNYIIYPFQN